MSEVSFGDPVNVVALTYRRRWRPVWRGNPFGSGFGVDSYDWHLVDAHGDRPIHWWRFEDDGEDGLDGLGSRRPAPQVLVPAPDHGHAETVCDVVRVPLRDTVPGVVIGATWRQAGWTTYMPEEADKAWVSGQRVGVYVVALDMSEPTEGGVKLRRHHVVDVHPEDLHTAAREVAA